MPGDWFRVKGGPIYVTDAGEGIPMYERGIFVFRRYPSGQAAFNTLAESGIVCPQTSFEQNRINHTQGETA